MIEFLEQQITHFQDDDIPYGCGVDMDAFDDLLDDGVSEYEAWIIVNTEMIGAFENESGGIEAWQTGCDVLHYDEALQAQEDLPDEHPADEVGDEPLFFEIGEQAEYDGRDVTIVDKLPPIAEGLPEAIRVRDLDGSEKWVDSRLLKYEFPEVPNLKNGDRVWGDVHVGDTIRHNGIDYEVIGGRPTLTNGQDFDGSYSTLPPVIRGIDENGNEVEIDPRNERLEHERDYGNEFSLEGTELNPSFLLAGAGIALAGGLLLYGGSRAKIA